MYEPRSTLDKVLWLQVILSTWFSGANSASILMSGLFGEGSHFLSLVPIGESLVRQGHEVTFLISKEYAHRADDPNLSKQFRFEMFSISDPTFSTDVYFRELAEIGFTGSGGLYSFFQTLNSYKRVLKDTCVSVLEDQAMMSRFESLDVIVSDMGWPCGVAIKLYLEKYSNINHVRFVFTTPTIPHALIFDVAGSPFNPAYMPSIMSGLTSSMGFLERTKNLLSVVAIRTFVQLVARDFEGVYEKFDLQDIPHQGYDVADLVLASFDFAVEFPFPMTPNIIHVGGLTARPAKPVPKDLDEFMHSSGDHGVIVFTLGTYFTSFTSSKPDLLGQFLDAFRRLPQKVVMQLKDMPAGVELPPNVKIMPWLPQNDLLGHPKTRMFLFHGGNNGFYEAIYHGVPMIINPFMGDQADVAVRVESHGIGLRIEKELLNSDYIYKHISTVLGNDTFTKKAMRLSAILRDQLMTAADRAAFWINHVTKFGGQYMRSPFHELSFIQYYMIDVIALISLILIAVVYFAYRLVKVLILCCLRLTGKSKPKQD